jgi:hypothetical protein
MSARPVGLDVVVAQEAVAVAFESAELGSGSFVVLLGEPERIQEAFGFFEREGQTVVGFGRQVRFPGHFSLVLLFPQRFLNGEGELLEPAEDAVRERQILGPEAQVDIHRGGLENDGFQNGCRVSFFVLRVNKKH